MGQRFLLFQIMEPLNDLLTQDDCIKILKNCLKRDDFNFENYTIQPFSETREGLVGEHYLVRIQYNETYTKSFFMKILNGSSRIVFELAKSLLAYEKEEFFYKNLLKQYELVNISTEFAPDCYFCKPYLIVLENLIDAGYRSTPKTESLDLNHCKVCLKTLAKFHAAGMIYEELKGKEIGKKYNLEKEYPKYFAEMIFARDDDNPAAKWLQCSIEGIFQLIDYVPEIVNGKNFKQRLSDALQQIFAQQKVCSEIKNTTLHGDLWSNNFLFAYKDGEPFKSKLFDYQILKYGPPSLDVIQFLYTNTRKSFRDDYFNELLDYYHKQLSQEFETKNLETILSKEEFLLMCEEVKLPAKLQALADRSITFLSDETYADALSSDEKLEKFIFDDRSKHIVSAFEKNEKFRDLITEDIMELRSLLFTNSEC